MKSLLLLLQNLDKSKMYKLADKVESTIKISQVGSAAQFYQEQDPGTGLEGLSNQFLSNFAKKDTASLDYFAQGQAGLDAPYRANIDRRYEGPTILETPSVTQEAKMTPAELFDLKRRNLETAIRDQAGKGEGISQLDFLFKNLAKTGNESMLQASIPTLTTMYSQLLRSRPSSEWSKIVADMKQKASSNPTLEKNISSIIQRVLRDIVRDAKITNNPKLKKDLSSNEAVKILNEYGIQPIK